MGVGTLVICSFLTTAEIFFILYSLNPHWLKVALGYSWVLDITLGVGMSLVMLSTGSLGGLIMSAISGAVLSLSLITMKKMIGYRKFKDGKWHEYAATMNKANLVKYSTKFKDNIIEFKNKCVDKLNTVSNKTDLKVA